MGPVGPLKYPWPTAPSQVRPHKTFQGPRPGGGEQWKGLLILARGRAAVWRISALKFDFRNCLINCACSRNRCIGTDIIACLTEILAGQAQLDAQTAGHLIHPQKRQLVVADLAQLLLQRTPDEFDGVALAVVLGKPDDPSTTTETTRVRGAIHTAELRACTPTATGTLPHPTWGDGGH